jgi:hypothetical protein
MVHAAQLRWPDVQTLLKSVVARTSWKRVRVDWRLTGEATIGKEIKGNFPWRHHHRLI